MCVGACTHKCFFANVLKCVWVRVHTNAFLPMYLIKYVWVRVHTNVFLPMYLSMCGCMYTQMFFANVLKCVWVRVHTNVFFGNVLKYVWVRVHTFFLNRFKCFCMCVNCVDHGVLTACLCFRQVHEDTSYSNGSTDSKLLLSDRLLITNLLGWIILIIQTKIIIFTTTASTLQLIADIVAQCVNWLPISTSSPVQCDGDNDTGCQLAPTPVQCDGDGDTGCQLAPTTLKYDR